jgi:hypothetical protein
MEHCNICKGAICGPLYKASLTYNATELQWNVCGDCLSLKMLTQAAAALTKDVPFQMGECSSPQEMGQAIREAISR